MSEEITLAVWESLSRHTLAYHWHDVTPPPGLSYAETLFAQSVFRSYEIINRTAS